MKRNIKKRLFILILLVLQFCWAGCDENNKKPASIVEDEETIAFVNNKEILLTAFHAKLNSFLEQYRDYIISNDQQLTEIKEIVINRMIDEELISQEAARKGIHVSKEEIQNLIIDSVEAEAETKTIELFNNNNLDEEVWKNQMRSYLQKKKLIEKEVLEKIPITKRQISSYYKSHRQDFTAPQAYRIRNITLGTEEEAKAILSQIKRGADFIKLVRVHSISPDKTDDGDLGFIEKGVLPLEMETAIFRLSFKEGKSRISDVIRSQDGYHIFKLLEYRRRKRLSLDQARPKIKQILLEQKVHEAYEKWLISLKNSATISVDWAMLAREEAF